MARSPLDENWSLKGFVAAGTVQIALLLAAASAFGIAGERRQNASALISVPLRSIVPSAEPIVRKAAIRIPPPQSERATPGAFPVAARPSIVVADTAPGKTAEPAPTIAANLVPHGLPGTSIRGDIEPSKDVLAAYVADLRHAIMMRKPGGLSGKGEVRVRFSLDRAGRLLEATLAASSGQIVLDRNALRMIRRAAPFTPPPDALSDDQLRFEIGINFH